MIRSSTASNDERSQRPATLLASSYFDQRGLLHE